MKILYYNWVPYDYKKIVGGGVQVYQANVLKHLVENNYNADIYFLSSGFKHNPFIKGTYFRKTKSSNKKVKSYEIITSPILSPMVYAGSDIKKYTDDKTIVKTFADFIDYCGGFDVIHINNFEGITPACMQIKEKYPNTKIIFSVHNYVPICPRVQYFQETNCKICDDFKNGKECVKCFKREWCANRQKIHNVYAFFKNLYLPHFIQRWIIKIFKKNINRYFVKTNISTASDFKKFRETNIDYINKYVDVVLAVSKRVSDICISHGIRPEKVKCSYIGTKFADNALYRRRNPNQKDGLTICYLGYARNDKGYFFMLDALSELPQEYKTQVNIIIAAKGAPCLERLSNFKSVITYDGYSHKNLKEVLSNVDLGLVPVIWEDNLPQVAIEMSALGIPILASSFGGASELTRSDLFKFRGGDKQDFQTKLIQFIKNPDLLDEYYKHANKLQTMNGHIKELMNFYTDFHFHHSLHHITHHDF